jgi:hypothetical protein
MFCLVWPIEMASTCPRVASKASHSVYHSGRAAETVAAAAAATGGRLFGLHVFLGCVHVEHGLRREARSRSLCVQQSITCLNRVHSSVSHFAGQALAAQENLSGLMQIRGMRSAVPPKCCRWACHLLLLGDDESAIANPVVAGRKYKMLCYAMLCFASNRSNGMKNIIGIGAGAATAAAAAAAASGTCVLCKLHLTLCSPRLIPTWCWLRLGQTRPLHCLFCFTKLIPRGNGTAGCNPDGHGIHVSDKQGPNVLLCMSIRINGILMVLVMCALQAVLVPRPSQRL